MIPFTELSYRGQAARLRKLALIALQQYGLRVRRVSLISHMNNTTFRVDGSECEKGETQRYVLRVNRPGFQDASAIGSELSWLAALRKEEGIVVPEPVRAEDGAVVVRASVDGVPESRDCVLFRWIHGRFFGKRFSPRSYRRAGELLARIHRHGLGWPRPSGFVRKTLDYDLVMGGQPGIDAGRIRSILSAADVEIMDRAANAVDQTMFQMGKEPEVFGLIHGDYHHRHFLFTPEDVGIIDFDECSWGYFAYDIAVTLSGVANHASYPIIRDEFLAGYRAVRRFPEEHEKYIAPLTAARSLLCSISIAGITDHPGFRQYAPEVAREFMKELRCFLENQG